MIEHGHLEALRVAAANAEAAFKRGNLEQVTTSAKQLEAVSRLEAARRAIFAELGIDDIRRSSTLILEAMPAELADRLNVEIPEVLVNLSVGQTLRYFRRQVNLSSVNFARRASISQSLVSNLENDKWEGNRTTKVNWRFSSLCRGLEFDQDDQRAKVLGLKFITEYPHLVGEIQQFFIPTQEAPIAS